MKSIGFIGTGVMGRSMAMNLLKQGYKLSVYNRTKRKADDLIREGAVWCDDVASCVASCDVVITMLGFPADVSQVYLDPDGVIAYAKKGAYLIDMTTTSPKLAQHIALRGLENQLHVLDAPVSGGDSGARNATLSIMVGGEEADFKACLPIFQCMGKEIVYQGKAGNGQHAKMANQIALAGALSGVCESLAYAKSVGLDPQVLLSSIGKGAAGSWQMEHNGPKMLEQDYAPGFYIKHFVKDMKLAVEEAEDQDLYLGVLSVVLDMFETMEQEGDGELGTQALIKYYTEV